MYSKPQVEFYTLTEEDILTSSPILDDNIWDDDETLPTPDEEL